MNPLLNPIFLGRVLKSYLMDIDKLQRYTNEEIKKFQNTSIKKIVNYAYQIPLYRDKYKKAGIYPRDIKVINDIEKFPFITKNDIRKYSPNGIISPVFNKKKAIISRTGGTTDRPILLYFDMYTVIRGMLGLIRALNVYNVNWRKTKMSLLLDLSERSFENEYFINSIFPAIKPIFSQKNIQIFDLFEISTDVVKKINDFQPEFIGGYPYALIQLTLLKNKGYGKDIKPRCIMSSGSYLDNYLRKIIEEVFSTKVYDFYAATESGPIAFECKNGNYHVNTDLIFPEFIKNGSQVSPGELGTLIVTKLYGNGTPIIRYTGIDDVVTTLDNDCNCGLAGTLIKKIHGRKNESILLPNGNMVLPSFLETILSETVYETKANIIRRIQIIQHKIDKLEIKILFDKELQKVNIPSERIIEIIKSKYIEKLGTNIEIIINEVDKFDTKDRYYICKINRSKFIEKYYLI